MAGRKDSFGWGVTLSPTVARLVDAYDVISSEAPDKLDFLHSVLCQVGMPRRRQQGRTFERQSGRVSLLMEAGQLWDGKRWREQPLPYGTRPRLAMIHISSEAVRNQSPVVDVGHSIREFLLRLGIDTSGRGYTTFKKQMSALAACHLTLGMTTAEAAVTINAKPFRRFEAWLHPTGTQATLWPAELELSPEFFNSLSEHAVPLDSRAVASLTHSALALDVYTWLAHRLCRVDTPAGAQLSWANMRGQFGQEYADARDFKRDFKKALRAVLSVYPTAIVEHVPGGLVLKPSPPPVRKTRVLVDKGE